ncbi:type II secretion system F family protein [Streptomyces sp. NPDC001822]|uniref:type II secretion system F family protein n=1 Tax=Streptomyces sp. NPDC001822 TaxID=3364614 RepID=UPI0036B3B694
MNGFPAAGGALGAAGEAGAVLGAAAYLALTLVEDRHARVIRGRGAILTASASPRKVRGRLNLRSAGWDPARRWVAPLAAWATGWALAGGATGCVIGVVAAYGLWRWQRPSRRRDARDERVESARIARQLPLAADLLASCISAGAGPRHAAEAVGESMGGPFGDRLVRTAAEIRLGGDPVEAWGRLGEIPGAAPLARCLERAGATGAPAAEPVARLADEMRAERASAAVARAQRAGVLITAPVGLCFLPAFLAVGVAPVIIGLATGLLHRN